MLLKTCLLFHSIACVAVQLCNPNQTRSHSYSLRRPYALWLNVVHINNEPNHTSNLKCSLIWHVDDSGCALYLFVNQSKSSNGYLSNFNIYISHLPYIHVSYTYIFIIIIYTTHTHTRALVRIHFIKLLLLYVLISENLKF